MDSEIENNFIEKDISKLSVLRFRGRCSVTSINRNELLYSFIRDRGITIKLKASIINGYCFTIKESNRSTPSMRKELARKGKYEYGLSHWLRQEDS